MGGGGAENVSAREQDSRAGGRMVEGRDGGARNCFLDRLPSGFRGRLKRWRGGGGSESGRRGGGRCLLTFRRKKSSLELK